MLSLDESLYSKVIVDSGFENILIFHFYLSEHKELTFKNQKVLIVSLNIDFLQK